MSNKTESAAKSQLEDYLNKGADHNAKPLNRTDVYHQDVPMFANDQTKDELFRLIVESSPNAIIVTDEFGKIVYSNSLTEAVFGYTKEEMLGKPVEILLPRRYRDQHVKSREYFIKEMKPRPMGKGRDLCALHKDGTEFPAEVGLNVMQVCNRTYILGSIIDITERKEAERALKEENVKRLWAEKNMQQTMDKLEESNADLEQFAYVVSHDLKEPLRMISGFAQLCMQQYKEKIDSKADEYLGYIVEGVGRMETLIDDLLTFSRIKRDMQPLAVTDFNTVLKQALSNLSRTIEETNASITYTSMPRLKANPTQMVQLFQNLISNSLKFCDKESPLIHLSAQKVQDHEVWQFSITDNGIGIESKDRERIFLIFQRLHTKEEYTGTGIGLSLCKKIVERHGGRIWVKSGVDVGSTFYFTIPYGNME